MRHPGDGEHPIDASAISDVALCTARRSSSHTSARANCRRGCGAGIAQANGGLSASLPAEPRHYSRRPTSQCVLPCLPSPQPEEARSAEGCPPLHHLGKSRTSLMFRSSVVFRAHFHRVARGRCMARDGTLTRPVLCGLDPILLERS